MLGFTFQRVPVLEDFLAAVHLDLAENMRVTINQLLADIIAHIVEIERSVFTFDLRMEYYLEQQVAKLFAKHFGAVLVDALTYLVGFLDKIGANTLVSLNLVPGAAVFGSQNFDDLPEVVDIVFVLEVKVCHNIHQPFI